MRTFLVWAGAWLVMIALNAAFVLAVRPSAAVAAGAGFAFGLLVGLPALAILDRQR